jgi:hypothetical protein
VPFTREQRREYDRQRQQRRRDEGKCTTWSCSNDALPSLTVCADCREAKKARNALRYAK